jgi:hypothetical protein
LYVLITDIIFENIKINIKIINNNKINKNFERRLLMSESEEIEYVIIVPDAEEYQIENLLKMKRNVNLKLVYFLDDNKTKQVLFICIFYLFVLISYLMLVQNIFFGKITFFLSEIDRRLVFFFNFFYFYF